MSELWKAVKAAWNPETACKKRKEDFIYIGDYVTVARGRKIPHGTCGKVLRVFENPYDPITDDRAKGVCRLCAYLPHLCGSSNRWLAEVVGEDGALPERKAEAESGPMDTLGGS